MRRDTNEKWDELSYIISSKVRLKILIAIANEASTPSKLSEKLGIPMSQVSTALKELSDMNIVKCLTPKRKKGRLYISTEKGLEILKVIHDMTDIS